MALVLTDGVEAVDAQARGASVSDVDFLQAVVWAVGQYDLYSHHTGLVQTGLPGEMVLGRQTFSSHMVKQLVGFHRAKRWSGDLERSRKKDGIKPQQPVIPFSFPNITLGF